LVNDGRDALDELEEKIHIFLRRHDARKVGKVGMIPTAEEAWKRSRVKLAKHRTWFCLIHYVAMILFFFAALYGFCRVGITALIYVCPAAFDNCS